MKLFASFVLVMGTLLSVSAFAQDPVSTGITIAPAAMADKEVVVGQEVCFDLVARDGNGNIIRSWDQIGQPVTLTLYNSTANTDTSTQSWSADPDDYTWARFYHEGVELTQLSDNEWTIPETDFENGTAEVCLVHTKADTSVYFEITPKFPPLNQISETIDFLVSDVTNFLIELTSSVPGKDQVYQYRKYEIIVSPRDRFLNVSNEEVKALFSARFPGEFVSSQPGFSDIFSGAVFLQGPTNYFLASTIERELPQSAGQLQKIRADGANNPAITGQTNDYEVLSHEPVPFSLQLPPDNTTWILDSASNRRTFTWEQPSPPDPYTNILVSNITGETASDVVTYEWVLIEGTSLTRAQRIASDVSGEMPQFSATNYQLIGIGSNMIGQDEWDTLRVVWFVEATDGLYTTKSSPPSNDPQNRPGHRMLWVRGIVSVEALPEAATTTALLQNYPNPFNPSTNIRFEIAERGPVSLKVYDLIGNEVATLVDEELGAGVYNATFDADALSTGVYIYRLSTSDKTFTRRMILSK